ncbi:hypothetical protein NX059_010049 [Plenodomus lindquistii]|nr:hypothetical protein NX059_010049 [Plenodomus lindquistii]
MTVTFGNICSLLQSIENITLQAPQRPPKQLADSKRQIISNWFQNQRENLDDSATNGGAILSVIFPHLRKDRVYGFGPPKLAKKLITLLRFNSNQRTLFSGWSSGTHGDLGVYTERAQKSRDGTFATKPVIHIDRVDRLLGQLAAKSRFSDALIRKQGDKELDTDFELRYILERLDSWEAKWLVRLILRDYCTIDIEEKFVYEQYHFLLPDLLKFQNDFDAVFALLRGELSCYPAHPDDSRRKEMRFEASKKLRAVTGIKVGRPTFHKAWSFKHCFQLTGQRAWAADVKYDGEYCEIHIDLQNAPNEIKIFSKNGKDATADRQALHGPIREALRIGTTDCPFKKQCIILGEMVLYSDREKKIMPFSKIRKHISRSGSFIGTLQDSMPHDWEHLMIVFFDVLKVDNREVLRHSLQDRRAILRDLIRTTPGRSMRSEWTLLDFKTRDGITDLKQCFARTLANRQEGLILKQLHAPYFPLLTEQGYEKSSYFIKLKMDYLSDMGGQRDLGDFAVIGASYDARVAAKADLKPLHWTHFHLGCCTNPGDVQRYRAKPNFKVVATLSFDKCIPKADLKYLNNYGYVNQTDLLEDGSTAEFDIEPSKGFDRRMTAAFKKPFVVEVLGGGFEKVQNETFEMLRHPRVKKIHSDRTWRETVTLEELERMADEKWEVPDADALDGHAKDVALLAKTYALEASGSQATFVTNDTTQSTYQTTARDSEDTVRHLVNSSVVLETQDLLQDYLLLRPAINNSSTQSSSVRIPRKSGLHMLPDLPEVLPSVESPILKIPPQAVGLLPLSAVKTKDRPPLGSKRSVTSTISPPKPKRQRVFSPLHDAVSKQNVGSFDFDAEEKTLHIYARRGTSVHVHTSDEEEE